MAAVSVETQNEIRRTRNAAKNAAKRAAAAARKRNAASDSFSMDEWKADAVRRAKRQAAAKRNGDRLLAELNRRGCISLSGEDRDYEGAQIWRRNCLDLLAAAKASKTRYNWNRDWQDVRRLNIAVAK